jgi:hypothetical protein
MSLARVLIDFDLARLGPGCATGAVGWNALFADPMELEWT